MFFLGDVRRRRPAAVLLQGRRSRASSRVVDEHTLAFPNYDGNGMYLSLGNVLVNPQIGMLLIDFLAERPSGCGSRGSPRSPSTTSSSWEYPGAQFVVRVQVQRLFPNCPRYIHRMALVERSPYVPRAGERPPAPSWKLRRSRRRGAAQRRAGRRTAG